MLVHLNDSNTIEYTDDIYKYIEGKAVIYDDRNDTSSNSYYLIYRYVGIH